MKSISAFVSDVTFVCPQMFSHPILHTKMNFFYPMLNCTVLYEEVVKFWKIDFHKACNAALDFWVLKKSVTKF